MLEIKKKNTLTTVGWRTAAAAAAPHRGPPAFQLRERCRRLASKGAAPLDDDDDVLGARKTVFALSTASLASSSTSLPVFASWWRTVHAELLDEIIVCWLLTHSCIYCVFLLYRMEFILRSNTRWCPSLLANLVPITQLSLGFMVDIPILHGDYKPIYITRGVSPFIFHDMLGIILPDWLSYFSEG